MALNFAVVLLCFSLVSFCVTIGNAIAWYRSKLFTVAGTVDRVDSCPSFCRNGIGPSGCIYSPSVTLSWTFNDTVYQTSNFSVAFDTCFQCCYQFVNKSIDVHIDPQQPSIAITFYGPNQYPENETDKTLTILFGVLGLFLLFGALIACCIKTNRAGYDNV